MNNIKDEFEVLWKYIGYNKSDKLATKKQFWSFIVSALKSVQQEERRKVIEEINKRMKIEKYRYETAKTEREYKGGKYIGLRYAIDIVKALNSKSGGK